MRSTGYVTDVALTVTVGAYATNASLLAAGSRMRQAPRVEGGTLNRLKYVTTNGNSPI